MDESRDSGDLLISRLEKVSRLLDAYYSSDNELGTLKLNDSSIGTYRIRQEIDHYIRGLSDSTDSLVSNIPPNFPISVESLREAKTSNHLYKRRLDSPWWQISAESEISDDELRHICSEADSGSMRIY